VQFGLPPGATVEDAIVEAATRGGVTLASMSNAVAVVGDYIVPKDRWKHTRPKHGPVVIKSMAADPGSLVAAAFAMAGSLAPYAVPVGFALAHPIITGIAMAGVSWVAPLHTRMTP